MNLSPKSRTGTPNDIIKKTLDTSVNDDNKNISYENRNTSHGKYMPASTSLKHALIALDTMVFSGLIAMITFLVISSSRI